MVGLKKHNTQFEVITQQESIPRKHCDLYVLYTNTYSKSHKILQKKPVVSLFYSQLQNGHLANLYDEEKPNQNSIIFSELLKNAKSFYIKKQPVERFSFNLELKPWEKTDKPIIISEQIYPEGYFNFQNLQKVEIKWVDWARETIRRIQDICGKKIIVTFKKNRADILKNHTNTDTNYQFPVEFASKDIFELEASTFVTLSSKSIYKFIMNGIPCFSFDDSAMGYDVCNHNLIDVCNPKLFDRKQWLKDISYVNWTAREIRSGDYFEYVKSTLLPAFNDK